MLKIKTRLNRKFCPFLIVFAIVACSSSTETNNNDKKTIVNHFGKLQVRGNQLLDKNNNPVVLRGMSLFWSQWGARFYNADVIKTLKNDWKCTVIRAAMAVEDGGYLTNSLTELTKIKTVVEACIEEGIYVIVDWHDHNAEDHVEEAKNFFKIMATLYGDTPNIIYEIFNEPLQVSWGTVIKPYAEQVIAEIRAIDPDNLIIAGTPTWSQLVNEAAQDPIDDPNIIYTLHFYTGTHTQSLRDEAIKAMDNSAPLFVSEFGISEASGDGPINWAATDIWMQFLDNWGLSWCNWSLADKNESSAALLPGADSEGSWPQSQLSTSGQFIKDKLVSSNTAIFAEVEN